MTLTLALRPGVGLGPFNLGQSLPEVLELLQRRGGQGDFRCVEVQYSAAARGGEGAAQDIVLAFPESGFRMHFDPHQQRLRQVEVHDVSRLQMRYGRQGVFGGSTNTPTLGRIYQAFGPTIPGDQGLAPGLFVLQYPGVLFMFPQQLGGAAQRHLLDGPAGFPVPLTTPAARICIYAGAPSSLPGALGAGPPPLAPGAQYMERVEAVPCQGILFSGSGAAVRFGDSPQDVVTELGPPSSTARRPGGPGASPTPDYALSYLRRGLDVVFCGATHRVRKLVLHTNAPGHPEFGWRAKCNFRLHPAGGWALPCEGGSGSSGSSMKTASSSSMAPESAAAATGAVAAVPPVAAKAISGGSPPAQDPAAAAAAAAAATNASSGAQGVEPAQQPAPLQQGQQQQQQQQQRSGLTAAFSMLVGLIDDVVSPQGRQDEEGAGPSWSGSEAAPAHAPPPTAAKPLPTGKPPRPPGGPPAVPLAPPSSKSSKKKKKQKAKKVAATAAGGEESDAEPASDSGISSLGSSPAGVSGFRLHGYSSAEEGSSDLASREQRLECGSAYDGWSDGDDLTALVGASSASSPGSAAPALARGSTAPHKPQPAVSTGVQTAPAAEDEEEGEEEGQYCASAGGEGPDSPQTYVMADAPCLFDEEAGAAEYQAVARQRNSGTQTQPHVLKPNLRAAAPRGSAGAAAAAAAGGAVTADSHLLQLQQLFGPLGKPAVHTRVGSTQPFGPTYLYACRGAVFEVLPSGRLATVTLFQP